MDQRNAAVIGRHTGLEPFDQPIHVGDGFRLGGPVLAGPARELALEIVAGLAEIAEADGANIDIVQGGKRGIHGIVDRRPLVIAGSVRQRRIPEDAAIEIFHDIEHAADRGFLAREMQHARHWHSRAGQRTHHPEFAVDLMRGFQQLSRRLGAKHIAAAGSGQEVGRI
jgi:hypothetical protein